MRETYSKAVRLYCRKPKLSIPVRKHDAVSLPKSSREERKRRRIRKATRSIAVVKYHPSLSLAKESGAISVYKPTHNRSEYGFP